MATSGVERVGEIQSSDPVIAVADDDLLAVGEDSRCRPTTASTSRHSIAASPTKRRADVPPGRSLEEWKSC